MDELMEDLEELEGEREECTLDSRGARRRIVWGKIPGGCANSATNLLVSCYRHCPGFNFNVEEWSATGQTYETLAICRSLELARAAFAVAVTEKPADRFMIRNRTRVVKRHPEGDC